MEAWEELCDLAGFDEGGFVSMRTYDDQLTFDLQEPVAENLGYRAAEGDRAYPRQCPRVCPCGRRSIRRRPVGSSGERRRLALRF